MSSHETFLCMTQTQRAPKMAICVNGKASLWLWLGLGLGRGAYSSFNGEHSQRVEHRAPLGCCSWASLFGKTQTFNQSSQTLDSQQQDVMKTSLPPSLPSPSLSPSLPPYLHLLLSLSLSLSGSKFRCVRRFCFAVLGGHWWLGILPKGWNTWGLMSKWRTQNTKAPKQFTVGSKGRMGPKQFLLRTRSSGLWGP